MGSNQASLLKGNKMNYPPLFALLSDNLVRTSFYQTFNEALIALRANASQYIEEIGIGIVYTRLDTE